MAAVAGDDDGAAAGGHRGGRGSFWSPDGRAIGFFAGALKRLDLSGGAPRTLVPAAFGGGTWNADGVILFAGSTLAPLMRVPATGGAAGAVTALGPQQAAHVAPHFLPDGRRFLFRVLGAPDTAGIYLGALDGSAPTRLTPRQQRRGVSARGPWARRSVSRRRLAAVGADGYARGPAAGCGEPRSRASR